MKIAIRADASTRMGSGHVMRCLTLADSLKAGGAEVRFFCREYEGNLCDLIEAKGFQVSRLPAEKPEDWKTDAAQTIAALKECEKVDWLIVDHYAIDSEWESTLREVANRIMVIDDLANRVHDCDLLLDQNLFHNMQTRYDELAPHHCVKLLGPKYALLRPEFRRAKESLRKRDGTIRRIFVFFGGSDPTNETAKALEAIKLLGRPEIAVDVAVGAANPQQNAVANLCNAMPNTKFHRQVDNMAELMTEADISIGAGGGASWERCCVGLPSIVIGIAPNQEEAAYCIAQSGASQYLGRHEEVSQEDVTQALKYLIDDKDRLIGMSVMGQELVDGFGAIRVANVMQETFLNGIVLRRATRGDASSLFEWRNAPETRRYACDSRQIAWKDHMNWLEVTLKRADRHLLIGEKGRCPIGVLRYDILGEIAEVSVYLVPGFHGKGLGSALLKAGNIWAGHHLTETAILRARILPENIISRKAFAKAGYLESEGFFEHPVHANRRNRT